MRSIASAMGRMLVFTLSFALLVFAGVSPAHAAEGATRLSLHLNHLAPGFLIGQVVNYTKVSDFQKGYKRATTKLYRTYTRTVEEYRLFDDIPDEEIMPSGRENLIVLDVAVGVGAHQVDDAGWESRTETPELEEGSFVFNHTNSRFSISLRSQAFDRVARGNQIIRQIRYQSLKCIEAVMRKYGFMTYGFSSGVLALVNNDPGNATTATVNLHSAFGQAGFDNFDYLASMFAIDEGVGFIRANALVATAVVTAVDPTVPSITVAFTDGVGNAVSADLAIGDQIVYANGVNAATLSETDWQKWNSGLLEANLSDDLHGLAGSVVPTWKPSLLDGNGGSFDFLKVRRIRQALANKGDTTLRRYILSNGVQNDKDAHERQALQWMNNSTNMNLEGNAKVKGATEFTSRFVPPTCAFGVGADAMGKKLLTDKPDEDELIDFARLFKAEDRSALKGGVDLISALIYRSRSRLTLHYNLSEQ